MSGGASLRNAVKRVTHKERSQPKARESLGLLEKHKDYVERAKNYHKKKDYLTTLKRKAKEKNPDEFYFKMNASQMREGVHKDYINGSLSTSTVSLLKTQDLGYINHKKSVDDSRVARLKQNLHLIGVVQPKKHKIFVEDEKKVESCDVAEHFETAPELAERSFNRPRMTQLQNLAAADASSSSARPTPALPGRKRLRQAEEKKERAYKELSVRTQRAKKLNNVAGELQLQRNLMGKGTKKKITTTQPDGKVQVAYKWKRVRRK